MPRPPNPPRQTRRGDRTDPLAPASPVLQPDDRAETPEPNTPAYTPAPSMAPGTPFPLGLRGRGSANLEDRAIDPELLSRLPSFVYVRTQYSDRLVLVVSKTWTRLRELYAAIAAKLEVDPSRMGKLMCSSEGFPEANIRTLDDLTIYPNGANVAVSMNPTPRGNDTGSDGPSPKRPRICTPQEGGESPLLLRTQSEEVSSIANRGVVAISRVGQSHPAVLEGEAADAPTISVVPEADVVVTLAGKNFAVNRELLTRHSPMLSQLLESERWADSDRDARVINLTELMGSSAEAVAGLPDLLAMLSTSSIPPLESRDLKRKLAVFEAADLLCMKELEEVTLKSIQGSVLSRAEKAMVQSVADRLNHQGLLDVVRHRNIDEYLIACIKNAVTDPAKHRTFAFSVICGYVNAGGKNLINLMAECLDDNTLLWEVGDVEFVTGLIDDSSCAQELENADVSRAIPLLASGRISVHAVAEFTCYCYTKGIMNSRDILQKIWIPLGVPGACPEVVECWPLATSILSTGW
eukprot:Hpha_TRINITY_DN10527_c0_g1::TRINITY_DN10527_c0_g1_i1::g.31198::m.31198